MFEKEAEEYANQSYFTEMPNPSLSEDIDISNEIKEAVLYGYNKANEWHYVKDEGLPKLHGWYWVQYINETFDCAILSTKQRFFNFYTKKDTTDSVLAWKEIVPPKEVN